MKFKFVSLLNKKMKQDGRLAPAYFSPNYKYFDQLLQTVKNKTTVLNLVFRVFTNINSTTDFCTLCKRVSRLSVETFLLTVPKNFVEEPTNKTTNQISIFLMPQDGRQRSSSAFHPKVLTALTKLISP